MKFLIIALLALAGSLSDGLGPSSAAAGNYDSPPLPEIMRSVIPQIRAVIQPYGEVEPQPNPAGFPLFNMYVPGELKRFELDARNGYMLIEHEDNTYSLKLWPVYEKEETNIDLASEPQRGNAPAQFNGGLNVSAGNELDSPRAFPDYWLAAYAMNGCGTVSCTQSLHFYKIAREYGYYTIALVQYEAVLPQMEEKDFIKPGESGPCLDDSGLHVGYKFSGERSDLQAYLLNADLGEEYFGECAGRIKSGDIELSWTGSKFKKGAKAAK